MPFSSNYFGLCSQGSLILVFLFLRSNLNPLLINTYSFSSSSSNAASKSDELYLWKLQRARAAWPCSRAARLSSSSVQAWEGKEDTANVRDGDSCLLLFQSSVFLILSLGFAVQHVVCRGQHVIL